MSCDLWSTETSVRETLAIAEAAARAAGQAIQAARTDGLAKGAGHDVVTHADGASEAILCEHLARAFPDHRIEGEEGAAIGPADSPRVWHLDPLDGTANFSRGIPYWAVSVGLAWRGKPVLGVIHAPAFGHTLTCIRGQGVWLDGVALPPAPAMDEDPRTWIVAVDWPWDLAQRKRVTALLGHLSGSIRQYKTYGSAALDCVNLARGWVDAYCITDIFPWDLCAGAAALQELGFRLADWQGQPWKLGRGPIRACRPGGEALLDQFCQQAWNSIPIPE